VLCGDYNQNDLNNKKEKSGLTDAVTILNNIKDVHHIKFGLEDIVRSGFVREYLTQKEKLGL
jgi:phosphate starvation-inducible PhoH-like protein